MKFYNYFTVFYCMWKDLYSDYSSEGLLVTFKWPPFPSIVLTVWKSVYPLKSVYLLKSAYPQNNNVVLSWTTNVFVSGWKPLKMLDSFNIRGYEKM